MLHNHTVPMVNTKAKWASIILGFLQQTGPISLIFSYNGSSVNYMGLILAVAKFRSHTDLHTLLTLTTLSHGTRVKICKREVM